MLEYWFKERRTLVDFRRGPLGPYFDGFAAYLNEKGYSHSVGREILAKSCLFNQFLIDEGITTYEQITPSLIEPFLDVYLANVRTTSLSYCPRIWTRGKLKRLFSYLVEAGILKPIISKPVPTQYSWVLDPYLLYLRREWQLTETTIQQARAQLCAFLEGLGEEVTRTRMKLLRAEAIETYVKQHLKDSRENLQRLVGTLRRFLRYCAREGYITNDLSGVIPSIPSYRLATLPKGMEDSALERILNVIPKDTATGARDYAIMLLMMAYGVRGKSVAELLLEDICWPRSTIRIRARKRGKEVVLPLLEAVGEAILCYLKQRPESPFREVFLSVKAPYRPIDGLVVSGISRRHMIRAGVKIPKSGSHTLRHSWAIRALAQDSPMKAIAV
ncbi:MAG: tyrosine-type recombinase/integrase [Thermodesulfobacteriota bacterium]|jgi:site-specific recombinase XerD